MQSNKLTLAVLNSALALSVSVFTASATPATAGPLSHRAMSRSLKIAQANQNTEKQTQDKTSAGSGSLIAMASSGQSLGQCPLKHTDVQTEISGYIARVTVKQVFQNPFNDKIEAVYTFPLSENGAVDEMVMKVGSRRIQGTIKKREEAREIYDRARAAGQVASLLDQERTNIFTQSVANIEPGKEIEITIKYIETLPYEAGKFTYTFPTVVGPRFIPGTPTGKSGGGAADDTNVVPDASRITPNVAPEGERAGHDISINVHLNAGMPVSQIESKLHQVQIKNEGNGLATVSLSDKATIPNKDFILSWNVAEDKLKSGYVAYRDPSAKDGAGYFTVMLIPPKRIAPEKVAPKEMVFVIDCSGSQSGRPLDKCKETMRYILDHMNAQDTFQIIAFSNRQNIFADKPQPVSEEMKNRARQFIDGLSANGGTWMAPAVEKACAIPADGNRLRIVTFMTDGYVGNDYEVLGMVKKLRAKSRWFSFGTGNSVNRTLIDGIAREGGGEPEYVLLNSSAEQAGKKFYDRISTPVLTDVEMTTTGTTTKEVYPKKVADVWAERPLYFKGKYLKGGPGTIVLKGFAAGKPYEQKLQVDFPQSDTKNEGIASMWARAKVGRLMSEDWFGAQSGQPNKEIKDEIVSTALAHHIMTQYTSFVAVDEAVTKGTSGKTVNVEVELPDGVSREGIYGDQGRQMPIFDNRVFPRRMGAGTGAGTGGGSFAKSLNFGNHGAVNMAAPSQVAQPVPFTAVVGMKSAGLQKESAVDSLSYKKAKANKGEEKSTGKLTQSLLDALEKARQTKSGSKGRLLVSINLKAFTAEIKKKLKALGVEVLPDQPASENATTIKAYVSVEKIEALAKLDAVLQIDVAAEKH